MTREADKDVSILHLSIDLMPGVDGIKYREKLLELRKELDGYNLIETLMRNYVRDFYRLEYKGVFRNDDDIYTFLTAAVTPDVQLIEIFETIGHVIGETSSYVKARKVDEKVNFEVIPV